ncbi:MAG: nucleotidyltransferase domain-containing protein [Planctomycetota bacterium]|nr:MAG: nucleotidyltransferase domain-containing protein [Planctomycetota bacterium]
MRVIQRYARAIAEEFDPDQIILFGSYAYGTPHEDSDVDLFVIMPARNQHDQAVRFRYRLAAPFPVDLIVRTPKQVQWRLQEGESFTTAIVSRGKILYEKDDLGVGEESRPGLRARQTGEPKQGSRAARTAFSFGFRRGHALSGQQRQQTPGGRGPPLGRARAHAGAGAAGHVTGTMRGGFTGPWLLTLTTDY